MNLFQWKPKLCEKIKNKIGRPLWLTFVLAIVIGGVIMNVFFFYLVTWRHLLSGALLGKILDDINSIWTIFY